MVAQTTFVLDSSSIRIERKVYSLSDVLAQIGGMKEILGILIAFSIGVFSNKMFLSSFISKLYYVEASMINKDNKNKHFAKKIRIEEEKDSKVDFQSI